MPRLKPITSKSDLPPEHQGAADEVVKVFGHIRGPFSMLLHSPGLAARLLDFDTHPRRNAPTLNTARVGRMHCCRACSRHKAAFGLESAPPQ